VQKFILACAVARHDKKCCFRPIPYNLGSQRECLCLHRLRHRNKIEFRYVGDAFSSSLEIAPPRCSTCPFSSHGQRTRARAVVKVIIHPVDQPGLLSYHRLFSFSTFSTDKTSAQFKDETQVK